MTKKNATRPQLDAGDVVAIPLGNGHWGALCVVESYQLSRVRRATQFFVVDGFWDSAPSPKHVARPKPMGHPYGAHHLLPGYDDVWKGWLRGAMPDDFVVVHRAKINAAKLANPTGTMVFQNAEQLRAMMLVKWREKHDAKAVRRNARRRRPRRDEALRRARQS